MSTSNFQRYQLGAPEDAQAVGLAPTGSTTPMVATARAVQGPISVQADGSVTQHGHQSFNTADFTTGLEGCLSSVRTNTGSPRMTGALEPTDRITYQNQEMTVQVAERIGILSRDASGQLQEVSGDPTAEPEVAPEVDPATAFTDAAAEQTLTAMCETVSAGTQVHALGQLITNGQVDATTLGRVASEMGVGVQVAQASLGRIMEGFKQQADQTLKGLGSNDPSFFYAWAEKEQPRRLQEAMRTHAMQRTTDLYGALYKSYVIGLGESDPEFVLNADHGPGVTAQRVGKKIVLNIAGKGQIEYGAAIRMGIHNLYGA